MNPLIKETVEKINQGGDVTYEVGNAILKALESAKQNTNYNMCGEGHIDENTIGNFEVETKNPIKL